MIGIKSGNVTEIIKQDEDITELFVDIEGSRYRAVNYDRLTGSVEIGNRLILNTTAIELSLGTGGYHFVILNLDHPTRNLTLGGHIMKLRYSPYQVKVFSVEEQESEYHDIFNEFQSLQGMPVIVGTLHSMLPPVVEVLTALKKDIRICYIMTDGAALPIDFSETIRNFKKQGKISATVTIGHAFGGDYECVNIYNSLITAREIIKADVAVITMGPGIVGTGTKYGFTGIEQGNIIDAVNDLKGTALAIPRISFADKRKRHFGISHHTITVLNQISKTKAIVGIPIFDDEKNRYIEQQLKSTEITNKHQLLRYNSEEMLDILKGSLIKFKTMGRGLSEEKEYFLTAAVAGKIAIEILDNCL